MANYSYHLSGEDERKIRPIYISALHIGNIYMDGWMWVVTVSSQNFKFIWKSHLKIVMQWCGKF